MEIDENHQIIEILDTGATESTGWIDFPKVSIEGLRLESMEMYQNRQNHHNFHLFDLPGR